MKNLGYVAFDSFLTDVKIVFSNLKRLDNKLAGVEDAEQVGWVSKYYWKLKDVKDINFLFFKSVGVISTVGCGK